MCLSKDLDKKINRLEYTKFENDILLGKALYNDFTFGVILNYFKDYNMFYSEDTNHLSDLELEELINNIKVNLNDLMDNYIYPIDIKESNILFNEDLTVKIIDLDDICTFCFNRNDDIAKRLCLRNLDDTLYRVKRYRVKR